MDFKIVSLNVGGIGNNTKRRELFNWLSSENTADLWACEWAYKTLFSFCSNNKAGVSILFNNTFNLQFSDPNGRFIICDMEANSKPLTLANTYAPNEDDPNFHCEEIIIGGDFNLVLDLNKDKRGGHKYQQSLLVDRHCCRNWLRPYWYSYYQVGEIQYLLNQASR